MRKILTLCIVHRHPRVLLGMKKRGFGAGRWNGFGGKVKEGETIEAAARRELREEAGIDAEVLERAGVLEFTWEANRARELFSNSQEFENSKLGEEPEILEMHLFRVTDFSGEPHETEEMRPQWFHIDEIPFGAMWPDDRRWMPLFLAGKKFRGRFLFDSADTIADHALFEVQSV